MALFLYFSLLSIFSLAQCNLLARGFSDLQSRQVGNCTNQCAPFLGFTTCTTADCVCTPLNNSAPGAVTACTDCLAPTLPEIAANITLLANVCAKCFTQCNTTVGAFLAGFACTNSTCGCAPYFSVGTASIEQCGNCVSAFDTADGEQVLAIPDECGLSNATASSSTAASSGSAAPSTGSATPSPNTFHSGGVGSNEMLWKLSIPGILGVIGIGFLLL